MQSVWQTKGHHGPLTRVEPILLILILGVDGEDIFSPWCSVAKVAQNVSISTKKSSAGTEERTNAAPKVVGRPSRNYRRAKRKYERRRFLLPREDLRSSPSLHESPKYQDVRNSPLPYLCDLSLYDQPHDG
jgi:hypothetical protein